MTFIRNTWKMKLWT